MPSLIRMTEEDHKEQLNKRHRNGAIFENLFRVALFVAVVALITLLIDVADEAFGTVLESFQIDPDTLADRPLEELSEEELGSVLANNMGTGQFIGLIRDNIGSVQDAGFVNNPLSEVLSGRTFPDSVTEDPDIDVDTNTIRDLSLQQQQDILVANASQTQLLAWVESDVVGVRIIDSWTFGDTIFFQERILEEAANDISGEVAEQGLERAGADPSRVDIEGAFVRFIGDERALQLSEWVDRTEDIILTDASVDRWITAASNEFENRTQSVREDRINIGQVQDRVVISIEGQVQEALLDDMPEMPETAAEELATAYAPEVVAVARDIFLADDPESVSRTISFDQEDQVTALVQPGLEQALEEGTYPDAELTFRSWLNARFLTARGRNSIPAEASLRTAIFGSIWVMIITMFTAFPLGVGAAIYLEEYADDNWLNNIIETNIRNLAGVPSIIYGILGLAIFVRALSFITSGAAFGLQETDTGRTILSAGLTLALLILPVIIINSQEAIRSVSSQIRQASYGLGATKWQTIWRQILPVAVPGILTGTILSFSRAVGETAPLIVVGAATAINSDPTNPFKAFTVIPIQIFDWTSRPQDQFRDIAAAAIIVLLILLITLNTTAILLRNRFSKRTG